MRKYIEAVATLIGTTIGAGILGMPYMFSRYGIITSSLIIILIGLLTLILNYLFGKVVIKSKQTHQLTGYTRIYLGKPAEYFLTVVITLFIYGAMSGYLVAISSILASYIPISPFVIGTLVFILFFSLIYSGLDVFSASELFMSSVIIALLIGISLVGLTCGHQAVAMARSPDWSVFGITIFAFMGVFAVPEMREENKDNKSFLRAIKHGTIIVTLLYLLFSIGIVLLTGDKTTGVATLGLIRVNPVLGVIANVIALLGISTTFLSLGFSLKEMYLYDYHFKESIATLLSCLPALIPFILGMHTFIALLSGTGIIFGSIIYGVLIAVLYRAL